MVVIEYGIVFIDGYVFFYSWFSLFCLLVSKYMGNVFKRFFFFLFLYVFVYLEFSSYKFDILRVLVVGVNLFLFNNICKGI